MTFVLTPRDLARLTKKGARSTRRPAKHSTAERSDELAAQLALVGIAAEREYRFHPSRNWRLDVALLDQRIAVEVEGGLFLRDGGGRHNRGAGMRRDIEKYNELAILGWRLIRVLPEWVPTGRALRYVERLMGGAT